MVLSELLEVIGMSDCIFVMYDGELVVEFLVGLVEYEILGVVIGVYILGSMVEGGV